MSGLLGKFWRSNSASCSAPCLKVWTESTHLITHPPSVCTINYPFNPASCFCLIVWKLFPALIVSQKPGNAGWVSVWSGFEFSDKTQREVGTPLGLSSSTSFGISTKEKRKY